MCCALLVAGCEGLPVLGDPTATVVLVPKSGSQVSGNLRFAQYDDVVRITGVIVGHTPGPKGFHIHEKGDCSAPDAMSAGGHFNPHQMKHGSQLGPVRHGGDLGNLVFDEKGRAIVNLTVSNISVSRTKPDGIVGRALVVHAQPDDLKTDPTGNAGGRAACGVIVAEGGLP
jgi:Cu-Zn family superoxide dismutase